MQNVSHSAHLHKKRCNATANSFYDDVFSAPNKFPLPPPSLSPRLQDYAEIFGAFNSRSSSSIPVLDLPLSVGAEDLFFDVRSSCFDYSEVFGGLDGSGFATSFEELVRMSGGEDDEAWFPEEGDYLSEGSEGSLKSERFSNRESCEYVVDGNDMKFNISYNKNGGRSSEDIAHFQPLPENTFVVDKASSLPKMDDDDDYVSMRLSDDGHFNNDLSRKMVIERPLKKTMSNPVNADSKSEILFEDDVRTCRDYVRTGSFPNETFVTISDVSLKTRPSKVPPPSRPPPPALEVKKKDSNKLIPNGKIFAFEGSVGDGSPPFLDVEVDANSSAAVSAAAIKDAVEKAQAKMKSAKELMDRKREGFQSRSKSGLKDHRKDGEGNIGRSIDGLGSNDGIETEVAEERQFVKRNRLVQHSLEGKNYPNGSKREENQARESSSSQGSVKIDEASEWKEATEFFELVRADKSKNIFDHVINESMLAQSTNVIEHGRKEEKENDKKGKPACGELEEYEKKLNISKEVSASQENNGRLEAAVAVQRQKGFEKKAQRSKEASRQKENEKKLTTDMQLAETERKQMITDDFQVNENMEVQYQEINLEVMEAKRQKKKEPHSKEPNKRSDEEKRYIREKKGSEGRKREALEKLDNEKKLNSALEQANKERRLKEDMMEQAEKEKRMKEAHEREENEKNKKEALEWEENVIRLEREENERRQREALEREENERRLMEALECEENERRLREALEREENERRLREAFEKQENERRRRETLEKEQKERRLREALEKEENERRLRQKLEKEENERRQKLEKEENERRLRQKLDKEENERRLRQKLEKEENERRQRLVAEQEEDEKRQRETFEREENERRSKEALEKKEREKRERQACEKEHENLLKKAFELEAHQKKRVEACEKEEIQKVRRDDFGNVKTESIGKKPEKIELENKPLREAQVGKAAEEGPKEIHNQEDFEDTSLEAHKPHTLEDTEDTGEMRNTQDGLRSKQNEAAGANANIDGEKKPSDLCQYDLEHENASEIPSEDGSVKSAGEAGHNLPPRKFASQKSSALNEGKIYTHESNEKGSKIEHAQVSQHHQDRKDNFSSTRMVKETFDSGKKVEATQPATSEMEGRTLRPAQQVNASQAAERKMKNCNDTISVEDKEIERIKREKELEMEHLQKMEEERDREREREKDRMAVDIATLEACERANCDARERAERAAIERALAEARQRVINEARERLEKACAEAREKSLSDKASVEARIRAERAAVERATAEARERAFEKAMAERAASEARERLERSVSDKFSTCSRNTGMRQNSLSSDLQDTLMQNSGSFNGSRYQYASVYGGSYNMERSNGVEGESPQRCKARLERHRRTAERAAKALAEKNMRDLVAQREQVERNRIAETLDAEVRRWSSGKEGNLRALLSTLQYILGPDSGWHPIPLTEVITSAAVKKAYRKATLCVHPDKLQQRGASIHQKYICEKVFDLLKEAWNKFNSEER